MDREWPKRLRMRAEAEITAALAAADSRAPSLGRVVADALAAVDLTCWDPALALAANKALIEDSLKLMPLLKELTRAEDGAQAELIVEVYRRTNDLLRRYAGFVRAAR